MLFIYVCVGTNFSLTSALIVEPGIDRTEIYLAPLVSSKYFLTIGTTLQLGYLIEIILCNSEVTPVFVSNIYVQLLSYLNF